MKQKILIEVETDKPIDKLGNGHVIVYDSVKKSYYAATAEQFMAGQNAKIKNLENKIENLSKQVAVFENSTRTKQNDFMQAFLAEKQAFLKDYKETNEKIIKMVKSFTNEEGV